MDQTTSGDQLFDTTLIEGLTDDVCPVSRVFTELVIITLETEDLSLSCRSGILLFKGDREPLKEYSFRTLVPMNRPSSEPLPLVFVSSDDIETVLGLNELTDLLEEDTLTFKDGLKTQDLVRCQINFV